MGTGACSFGLEGVGVSNTCMHPKNQKLKQKDGSAQPNAHATHPTGAAASTQQHQQHQQQYGFLPIPGLARAASGSTSASAQRCVCCAA